MPQATGVSVREFARLAGCDRKSVYRALERGMLARNADGSLDPTEADGPWRKTRSDARESPGAGAARPAPKANARGVTDVSRHAAHTPATPQAPAPNPYREAVTRKEDYAARLREIEYLERIDKLIDRDVAVSLFFQLGRQGRDAWMDWAVREAPMLASKFDIDADLFFYELRKSVENQCAYMGRDDDIVPPELEGRGPGTQYPGASSPRGPGTQGDASQGSPAPAARRLNAGHPVAPEGLLSHPTTSALGPLTGATRATPTTTGEPPHDRRDHRQP